MNCSAGRPRARLRASLRSRLRAALCGVLLAALGVLGCSEMVGPPFGAVPMQPHPVYALWWAQVEACSGRSGELGDIEWYVMPADRALGLPDGSPVDGLYQRAAHRIVLREDSRLAGSLVRHEMLHALVPTHAHRREDFLGACEGVVTCGTNCTTEIGPPPVPDLEVPRIPPEDLQLAITVEPASPAPDLLDGHFSLVITATNPYAHDVVVSLPPSGDAGPPVAFSFWFATDYGAGSWYNGRIHDEGSATFTAGQTKRAVFDFQAADSASGRLIAPGRHTAKGGFSSRPYAAEVSVHILP